ncbi:MAG: flagellin N-terminal helical domain-containing protein [Planctomycetota bacterium]|jgi:flagellin
MLGVNNNVSSIFANNQLQKNTLANKLSLQKLSSGFKINTAKDNPAGLIISEYLRSQLGGIETAIRNSQESYNTLSIAEGGMTELSSMLTNMRGLALSSLNSGITSSAMTSANQSELNGMLSAFDRITSSTNYAGQNLLNGAQQIDFTARDNDSILDTGFTQINSVSDISGNVGIQYYGDAADQAEKAYLESAVVAGGNLTEGISFSIQGDKGEVDFEFAAGTALTDVASTINDASDRTGVTAYSIQGDTQLRIVSEDYGADASVRVEQDSGSLFTAAGATVSDTGQNATLNVGGERVETNGLAADISNPVFSGSLVFNEGDTANTTVAQTGYDQDVLTDASAARSAELGDIKGGMRLQLSESSGAQGSDTFGINSALPSAVGRTKINGETYSLQDLMGGGKASLANDPEAALKIIDQAITDISSQRARIGAYQANNLQTNINSLQVAAENVTATESDIRDTNFAQEMSNFIRTQLLQRVGLMNVQSANVNSQNVLKILGIS